MSLADIGKTYVNSGPIGVIYKGITKKDAPWSANIIGEEAVTNENENRLLLDNREWAEEQAQKQMDFQTSANKIAMDFSSAEADKARAWEAELANSAYQRAVVDLKRAGLNPILAYSQGGASVPSVSSAQGVTSSGARASTSDLGYTERDQELDAKRLLINSAMSILAFLAFKK